MNLSFRLGKIPVRVLPAFFVTTLIFGVTGASMTGMVAWMVVVFVSVLVHELGHAAMGLAFGLEPRIELHGMGGTTSWTPGPRLSSGRRIAISLAGPFAGFAFAGLAFAVAGAHALPPGSFAALAYGTLLYVNIFWGIANLLPVLPLDGGNVMAQVTDLVTRGRGERAARIISIGVAGIGVAYALLHQMWWGGFLAGSFVAMNWRGLQDAGARAQDAPMRAILDEAHAALDVRDVARVIALVRPVALGARTAPVRAEALQLLAAGFLLDGRPADADAAIAALPPGFAPPASILELRARFAGAPRPEGADGSNPAT